MILLNMTMPKSCLGSIQCPYAGFMCDGYSNYKGDIMDLYSKRADNCPIIAEIPDNPTNGDIITALFSQYGDEVFDLRFYEDGKITINTDSEWWDTPYKGGYNKC